MCHEFETTAVRLDRLSFESLSLVSGTTRFSDVVGLRTDDGLYTVLALLISDQCPWGVTVVSPGGRAKRFDGCVLRQLRLACEEINAYNPKRLVEGTRSPVDQFPRPAVREAMLNAIVHRDYSDPSDIMVRMRPDNVEVVSPGSGYKGNRGIRNPGLVKVFELYRLKGFQYNGLDLIRKAYSRSGYMPSIVSRKAQGDFVVGLPSVDMVLGHYEGKKQRVLSYMSSHGGVRQDEVADLLKVTFVYAGRILRHMEADGLVFSMNVGRMRRFYLCDRNRRSCLPHLGQNSAPGSTFE